ncbi:DUF4374 domain-containing protein [Pedobacter sp. L105]|uniref:DUF4374 domain-containing protein n=1 Tax=Pedobacter sp. L105 TaxID=1641871 RepID=UPI00131E44D9|nr:DUF4374 domain-containing protein [Pedobacter sp. L105]
MYTIKQLFKSTFFAALAITAVSCSKDKGVASVSTGTETYALGVGITDASNNTVNYVVQASNLMTGTISATSGSTNNPQLQTGYRDYSFGGGTFYSVGGLGVSDATAYTLDASGKLSGKTGLTFDLPNTDLVNVDGTTMIGGSFPTGPTVSANAQLYTLNIAGNTITNKVTVPMNSLFPTNTDWTFYTGMVVSGSQLFQTFYPVNASTYETLHTDTNYVAVYSYPALALQKVIKDTRTGPSGAFGTRSGIIKTDAGDVYTISNSSFANGYSQSTKPAGILKIAAGTTVFDPAYFFNTDTAPNGGKIAHAKYISGNLIFVEITTTAPTLADRWGDKNLQMAIVDLSKQTITPVSGSPVFSGNGGRSFDALVDNGKVYTAITVNGVTNIYQVDVATATVTKGAIVSGTFVGGMARLK